MLVSGSQLISGLVYNIPHWKRHHGLTLIAAMLATSSAVIHKWRSTADVSSRQPTISPADCSMISFQRS